MSDFMYYNINPKKETTFDCVCRAISLASGLPYLTTSRLLDLVSEHTGYDRITLKSYSYLLEKILLYPVFYCDYEETVDEVIEKYPHNTLLIRIDGHLLCAVASVITDLWDSRDRLVTCYWIAK